MKIDVKIDRLALWFLVVALFVSLAANVLYGGIAMGRAAKPLPMQAETVALGPILKSLPEADRRLMKRAFAQHRDELAHAGAAAKASASALREALKADPYDPQRVEAALADYRSNFHALHDLEQNVFWEAAEHISPRGRAMLADSQAFEKMLK